MPTASLDDINTVTLFLLRMCEPKPGVLTTRQAFYSAYVLWVDMENERSMGMDAQHEDDPDWLTVDPSAPMRSASFFSALPAAMSKVMPSAFASREIIGGIPKGQRGFKGVRIKTTPDVELPSTMVKPSVPVEVGGPPASAPGLEFAKRAFLAGYDSGYRDGETSSAEGAVPFVAWDDWLNSLDPFATTLRRKLKEDEDEAIADAGGSLSGPAHSELDTDGY